MSSKGAIRRIALLTSLISSLLLLSACGSNPTSRYQQRYDSEPSYRHNVGAVADAVPRIEARSRGGNKSPYRVFGKQYWVMPSSLGYTATGTASWYGSKFHGHQTSNGEIYNMYSMTAAHKSLPIPTYAKVTNLNNGRHVIVRVNDRGPFHGDRLIDLSYAAATKLGYAKLGTAQVRIEAIDPVAWQREKYQPAVAAAPAPLIQKQQPQQQPQLSQSQPNYSVVPAAVVEAHTSTSTLPATALAADDKIFVQVGAFSNLDSAQRLKHNLQTLTGEEVVVYLDQRHAPILHKVHVGPIRDLTAAQQVRDLISRNGFGTSLILALPQL